MKPRGRRNDRLVWISLRSIRRSGIPAGKIDNCKRWLTRLSKSKSWISIKESCRRSKARPQRASSLSYSLNEWSVAFSSLFLIIFEKYSSESWESWSSLFIYIFWITWKQICGDNFIFFKDLWEEVTEVIGMATFRGHVGHGWLRDRRMSNVTHIRSLSRVRSKNILRLSFVFCSDYTI